MKAANGQAQVSSAYTSLTELMALRHPAAGVTLASQFLTNFPQSGQTRSRLRGSGIEFEEVRPYTPGDDIRSIDWRLSARTGKPMTKIYAEEREQPVYLVVDQRSQMFFGSTAAFKSVTAAHIAAHLCWLTHMRSERLGGLVVGEHLHKVKIQRSQQSIVKLLNVIADMNTHLSIESRITQSLTNALSECKKKLPVGARVVVISDFFDLDKICAATLIALGKRHHLQLIKVSDTLEDTLAVAGHVGISNGMTAKQISVSKSSRERYIKSRLQQHSTLLDCAAQCETQLLCLTEKNQLESALSEHAGHGIA